jgi:uncharacterized protein (UPF0276 family)
MLDATRSLPRLPAAPGVGYKAQHFADLRASPGPVQWLEIHAENYMGDGGRPHAQLRALRSDFAISVHGVGLSIGGSEPLDNAHLTRLKTLLDWLEPASFSEHLAWSTHGAEFLDDLLPLPYTDATLAWVCDHIDQVQTALGRQMLLENPSSYLAFAQSTLSETEFLTELVRRTGCGLLLDVNNVFISATNLGYTATGYLEAYPLEAVGEIHVGGHAHDHDDQGAPLLIDSHASAATGPVWALLDHALAATGPAPVLVEWDNDVPDWPTLRAEADRAQTALATVGAS